MTQIVGRVVAVSVVACTVGSWLVTPAHADTQSTPVPGEIWINEVMANPTGPDTGNEWVELANVSTHPLNITGLKIVRASGATVLTVAATSVLPAGGFIRVASASLLNSGDTLTLRAGTADLDRAVYDATGPEGWSWSRIDETTGAWTVTPTPGAANVVTFPTPTAVASASSPSASPVTSLPSSASPGLITETPVLSTPSSEPSPTPRLSAPVPTPILGVGSPTPTPLASVPSSATPIPAPSASSGAMPSPLPLATPVSQPVTPTAGDIWINEVLPNPTGTDTGSEWIELVNTSGHQLELRGLTLKRADGQTLATWSDGVLGSGSYLQMTQLSAALINGGDTLRLYYGDSLLDEVTYDTAPEGRSWARQSAEVGMWTPLVTPGAANAFSPEPTTPAVPVILAEVGATPAHTATTAAAPAIKAATAKTVSPKTASKAATKKTATKSGTKVAAKSASAASRRLPSTGIDALVYLLALSTVGAYRIWQWKQR